MVEWLELQFANPEFHVGFLILIIAAMIALLSKGADILVDEAIILSTRWGVPKVMIGATIVSLGTTLPEAAVSVFAAIKGVSELALGNAVGSIICNSGLILGTAALIRPLPLDRSIVNRHGWIQLSAGLLLILGCLPYRSLGTVFETGGKFPQAIGFVFVVLLALYLWLSVYWTRGIEEGEDDDIGEQTQNNVIMPLVKLFLGVAMVIISSQILIPAAQETAKRFGVPPSIIAATLVAFGTSLPELVTAVTASLKKQGELAVGNVIGANILNVLFVVGVSAAVTPGGLTAEAFFFRILFPVMLGVFVVFRVGAFISEKEFKRSFGVVLILIYIAVTILSYKLSGT
ncbi:MAG: calcium/sodium antiporter [Candidatus Poribacteria bacterium]|nr:calcium/sodium antiporter [Candidatus Poribacteria bacterium]